MNILERLLIWEVRAGALPRRRKVRMPQEERAL
jgi:hypothetical protein